MTEEAFLKLDGDLRLRIERRLGNRRDDEIVVIEVGDLRMLLAVAAEADEAAEELDATLDKLQKAESEIKDLQAALVDAMMGEAA